MKDNSDKYFIAGKESLENKEFSKAISCFKQSASLGNNKALFEIGEIYHIQRMFPEAYEWYSKAIEKHDTNAMVAIAIFYRYGAYKKKNKRYAFMYNERAARCGNDMAMLELSELYYWGEGVKKSYAKSLYWLERSAHLGNELAMNSLAECYLEGAGGVKKDCKMAIYWYEKAANSIIISDQIADLYFFGEKFGSAPFIWNYNGDDGSLCLCHEIKAQILLDILDESECRDINKAIFWYKECARRQIKDAGKKLAYLYENGLVAK